ncbi:hypothetical protein BCR36DRAFT_341304, partial [Piromyces finnis]
MEPVNNISGTSNVNGIRNTINLHDHFHRNFNESYSYYHKNNNNSREITGLKHCIMSYLFKKAYNSKYEGALNHFYLVFDKFINLKMYKMQIINTELLLIKYGNVTFKNSKYEFPNAFDTLFFVIYDYINEKVISIHENSSEEMLEIFKESTDLYRDYNKRTFIYDNSPSGSFYINVDIQRRLYFLQKAKNGGKVNIIKRLLSFLPTNHQSFVKAPYFDRSLFYYDDNCIRTIEYPQPVINQTVRFCDRKTKKVKFELNPLLNIPDTNIPTNKIKSYIYYTFHPTDPFIISFQQFLDFPSIVNFYVR